VEKFSTLTRSIFAVAAAGLLMVGTAGFTSAQAAPEFVFKLGHTLQPDSHYGLMALEFARLVKERSNGKIEVQLFPQSQLGGEVQMTQALRTGTQEMEITAQAPVVNTIKEWEIFDLPYIFDSIDQANNVLQGTIGKKFLKMMEPFNMIGLAWISVGERDLFTGKKTIASLDDLKDLKVRVMQSPGYIAGYKALGANPTPLAYSQLFLALSQGVVDAADTSPDQFLQDKFADISKHFYLTHVHYLPVALVISKFTWNKLTPDLQKVVQDSANDAALFDLKEYRKQYDAAIVQMKARGIEVVATDTKPWADATAASRSEFLAKVPNGAANYQEIIAAKATVAK
jgi:tripartite ATP-independent transporter DctP family solute receptor